MNNYILDEHGEPTPVDDIHEWATWFEANRGNRHVAKTTIDSIDVSTVFLSVNHQYGDGPPLLFETMIFGLPSDDEYCERYSTRAEAQAGHERACEFVKARN